MNTFVWQSCTEALQFLPRHKRHRLLLRTSCGASQLSRHSKRCVVHCGVYSTIVFSGATSSNSRRLRCLLFILVMPVSVLGIKDRSYRTRISEFSSDIPDIFWNNILTPQWGWDLYDGYLPWSSQPFLGVPRSGVGQTYFQIRYKVRVISGFPHDLYNICALLGCYAACSGKY